MGVFAIRQPNGNYGLWTTERDAFFLIDLTRDEVEKYFIQQAIEDAKDNVERMLAKADDPKDSKRGWPEGWDHAVKKHMDHSDADWDGPTRAELKSFDQKLKRGLKQ